MYLSLLFTLVVATLSVGPDVSDAPLDLTTIYESGSFDKDLIEPRLLKSTMYFAFHPVKCASSFVVTASEDTRAIVQVILGHDNGVYKWGTVGNSSITQSEPTVEIEEGIICAARFRIFLVQGSFETVKASLKDVEASEKRVIACTVSATNQWPKECKTAAEGPRCLSGAICGCVEDADCYSDTTHPFCNTATNVCSKCTSLTGTAVNWGYRCRTRYPSRYYVDTSLTTGSQSPGQGLISNTASEEIPTGGVGNGGFFKEICVTGTATTGGCDRCDQANPTNTPANMLNFPTYTGSTPDVVSALTGSYFCGQVRGPSSPTPTRPLCIMEGLFTDVGMGPVWQTLQATLEVANYGAANGGPEPAVVNQVITQTLDLWQGTCAPCSLLDMNNKPVYLSGLCLAILSTAPVCDHDPKVGCRGCLTNADCAVAAGSTTATCGTDGSGSCTGGNNCQLDGSCFSCMSDADCGATDGGEMKGQTSCDLTSHTCVTPPPCDDNFGGTGTNLCLTTAPNCNANGACILCKKDSDCGVTDGGTTKGQVTCYPDGICRNCDYNNPTAAGTTPPMTATPCPSAAAPNCNMDGTCIKCSVDMNCGGTDGGETANQPLCLTNGICATCDDNNGGTGGMTPCPTAAKPNCNVGGLCIFCNGMATCGATDGGQIPNQPVCLAGVCIGSCDDNFGGMAGMAPCGTGTAPNCNLDGSCIKCLTDKDCGVTDGGQTTMQPLCLPATGICDSCTDNFNVAGAKTACPTMALPNCNANGLCIKCLVDTDCGMTDGGSVPKQSICDVPSGTCILPCNDNFGGADTSPCPTSALPNCNANGHCISCNTKADCGVTDGGRTPGQTLCNPLLHVCINACTVNFAEMGSSPCDTVSTPNCNLDGTCIKCLTNADCGATDGGSTPGQQVCDVPSGICVPCTVNADCKGTTGANCQASGLCIDCTTSPATICTTTADGGQPKSGPCKPTGSGYCPDMNGQTICNTATKLCESPCLGNNWCSDKKASGIIGFNDGLNCQLDGTCFNCQTPFGTNAAPIPNSPNCGKLDGPLLSLVGARGKPGQTECEITGVCSDPVGPRTKFTPGPPTLLFSSIFNSPINPLLAHIEYDRQNNIKGTVKDVNGTAVGILPPQVLNGYSLSFGPSPFSCEPGTGTGVAYWGPFRLDHNTVWNDGAQAVEDNIWVFSWRATFLSAPIVTGCPPPFFSIPGADASLTYPWYAIYSFPTAYNPGANMVVALRSRPDGDEIAVFIGEDPSIIQTYQGETSMIPFFAPAPVASWKLAVPLAPAVQPQEITSYIISIPHPDRTPVPTVEIYFRASPGDFSSTSTYSDIAAWLDNLVLNAATDVTLADILPIIWTGSRQPAATRVAFSYPDGTGLVGNFSATYQLTDSVNNTFVWADLEIIADAIYNQLQTPDSADVLNSAQDPSQNIFAVHFTSIAVNTRYPGGIPQSAAVLWINGDKQPLTDSGFEPAQYVRNFFFEFLANVQNWGDVWRALFPGNTVDVSMPSQYFTWSFVIDPTKTTHFAADFTICAAGTISPELEANLQQEIFSAWVASASTSPALYYMKPNYIKIGVEVTTVPDGLGLGGFSSCQIDLRLVGLDTAMASSPGLQLNSDSTPLSPGPFVVVGGNPQVWYPFPNLDGFAAYRSMLSNVLLEDLGIYSVAAADVTVYALDESFLRTEVFCGDGDLDPPEECDSRDPSCTTDCTCPLRTVPLPPIGCTVCGNGIRDWEAFDVRNQAGTEKCEYTLDPNCKTDCTGCVDAVMVQDLTSGLCTYCGNGKLDLIAGETCDWKIDSSCSTDCKSCAPGKFPTGLGGCFLCGNGFLDAGEVCDDGSVLCSSDCTSCAPGYVPDAMGGCTKCGNGVVDPGEICDTHLTSCLNCRACDDNHVPASDGSGCTRCGNGALDAGEICDTAYPSCNTDCQSCMPGTVPAGDKLGSCSLCGNGVLDKGEQCDGDQNCIDCLDCREPYVLVPGGRCLLCGNGLLDDGEVCDAAHTDSCASACQACLPNFEANLDPVANPTGRCFPTSCDSAPTTDNSSCQCK